MNVNISPSCLAQKSVCRRFDSCKHAAEISNIEKCKRGLAWHPWFITHASFFHFCVHAHGIKTLCLAQPPKDFHDI